MDSGGGGSERVGVRARPSGLALVERVDRFGVAGLEGEVEQLEVLVDLSREQPTARS